MATWLAECSRAKHEHLSPGRDSEGTEETGGPLIYPSSATIGSEQVTGAATSADNAFYRYVTDRRCEADFPFPILLRDAKFGRASPSRLYDDLHIVAQGDEETHQALDRISVEVTGQHR